MSNPEAPSLPALLDAFNAHDVDAILSFFTEDCVFDTPRGPAPGGHRFVGKEQVRKGIQARFDGTGGPIEVRGCDLFEFADGRISRKDSFWKIIE